MKETKLLKKLTKEYKNKKWDDYSSVYKNLLINKGLIGFLFIFWMAVGLFTFNWLGFLLIILLNIIISPTIKLLKYDFFYKTIHWLNSFITIIFCFFIIINSYHLKIDLYELFLQIINK